MNAQITYVGNIGGPGLKRFILGDPIKSTERKTFMLADSALEFLKEAPSGSIGFMDVGKERHELPTPDGLREVDTLQIYVIGIEPEYIRDGRFHFGSMLAQHAIGVAGRWKLEAVFANALIPESGSREMFEKNGFTYVPQTARRRYDDYCYKWV